VEDLSALLAGWPVDRAAAGATDADSTVATGGDPTWQVHTASVSKLLVGLAALLAVEEGAITLDEPVELPGGEPGGTVRHLLAHASGLAFDQDRLTARPGRRRTYSDVGIERFAAHLAARTGIPFADYLHQAVTGPLGMDRTSLRGSPAHDVVSTVDDLLRFARELLRPALVSPATLAEATRAHFPDLAGVLPGVGRFDPNPWGLTFELRDGKRPHWTGTRNSPQTFGHFGGSGTFLWVDPAAGLGCVALTERRFGPWALEVWPPFSDAVLERAGGGATGRGVR
jgi:CubicO group peptidase (beta-lactamase class C family)